MKCEHTSTIPLLLFVITIATRVPFTSKMLYHMDSVNFAMAMDHYDVVMHQPHPPGYFLYVMLGRFLNFFVHDANVALVSLSILFGALTVVVIYYLGKELYNPECALLAALLAITSPNLWFHGEVALTYVIEAFFSTWIAFLCWKVLKGEERLIWIAAIVLAIAGGIRQNTPVFLFPLYLFSIRQVSFRKIIASLGLFIMVSLCWFIPMIRMTGGLEAYVAAFRELWLFNTGHNSVFEKGLAALYYYSQTLFTFITWSIGGGIIVFAVTIYHIVRKKRLDILNRQHSIFFSLWILPSFLFYLLIFVANPGYVLIFIPAIIIFLSMMIKFLSSELSSFTNRDISLPLTLTLVLLNILIFIQSTYPVSYSTIRRHDKDLSAIISGLRSFDPSTTALFVGPYILYGFRQVMYYLPEYTVYQPDYRTSSTGEVRKTFWGTNNRTLLTSEVLLPEKIKSFATVVIDDHRERKFDPTGMTICPISSEIFIASGPITLVQTIYPKTAIKIAATMKNRLISKAP